MRESKRKYLSEFAVSLYSARWLMVSADQLASGGIMSEPEVEISRNCHIYLICKMPVFSFNRDTFAYEKGVLSGHLSYSIEGEVRSLAFSYDFPLLDDAIEVVLSKYPHREIHTLDRDGKVIRYLPASTICIGKGMHLDNPELSNLEVLYIGQAFGDGSRTAFERLQSHSTLQKILADAHYSYPESAINLLTFEYVPYQIITQMDGTDKSAISGEEDKARFLSIIDNPLTEHQQVCLTEAGLIRYFQPIYNEKYKEHFPLKSHKILESCYELDFSGLVVEINTDELRFALCSQNIKAKEHHICKFNLVNDDERWGFFHLFSPNDESGGQMDIIS